LAELEAQCRSDLEREVLRAIYERGLRLPDAAQKTLYDSDEPIAIAAGGLDEGLDMLGKWLR